jgi:hypothetical protein
LSARDDGRVSDGTTDHGIARANLLGHVYTAATANKFHVQTFLGVIALGLRQHPGPKSRQKRWCRQQIGDFLRGRGRGLGLAAHWGQGNHGGGQCNQGTSDHGFTPKGFYS